MIGVFALTTLTASAATFKVGDVYEHKTGSLFDDIYIAGGSVDVSGDVIGDGLVVGGDVSVRGNISQDITTAGGSVDVIGVIGDDVRVAGGDVSISSRIGDDLVAAGGLVKVLSDSTIAGDAVIAAGSIIMSGTVSGDLKVVGEELYLNGPVNGDVIIRYAKDITFGDDAIIAGSLTYASDEELTIPEGLTIGGEITRTESPFNKFEKKDAKKFMGFLVFGKFIIMLVTALLAVLVFKKILSSCRTGWTKELLEKRITWIRVINYRSNCYSRIVNDCYWFLHRILVGINVPPCSVCFKSVRCDSSRSNSLEVD